jgi:hypothetical protein
MLSAMGRRMYGKGARCEGEMDLVIYIAGRNADAGRKIGRNGVGGMKSIGGAGPAEQLSHRRRSEIALCI